MRNSKIIIVGVVEAVGKVVSARASAPPFLCPPTSKWVPGVKLGGRGESKTRKELGHST